MGVLRRRLFHPIFSPGSNQKSQSFFHGLRSTHGVCQEACASSAEAWLCSRVLGILPSQRSTRIVDAALLKPKRHSDAASFACFFKQCHTRRRSGLPSPGHVKSHFQSPCFACLTRKSRSAEYQSTFPTFAAGDSATDEKMPRTFKLRCAIVGDSVVVIWSSLLVRLALRSRQGYASLLLRPSTDTVGNC